MPEKRRYARVKPPSFSSRVGRIVIDPKTPSIECTIIDLSAGGACLEVGGTVSLPKRFEFFAGGTRKKCNLVWSRGRRVGISF
jgi:hypothetical protein